MFVQLSGLLFEIKFCFAETKKHFKEFEAHPGNPVAVVHAEMDDFARAEPFFPEGASEDVKEWITLRRCFSDILPAFDRCLFHGTAMVFDGKDSDYQRGQTDSGVFRGRDHYGTSKSLEGKRELRLCPCSTACIRCLSETGSP